MVSLTFYFCLHVNFLLPKLLGTCKNVDFFSFCSHFLFFICILEKKKKNHVGLAQFILFSFFSWSIPVFLCVSSFLLFLCFIFHYLQLFHVIFLQLKISNKSFSYSSVKRTDLYFVKIIATIKFQYTLTPCSVLCSRKKVNECM